MADAADTLDSVWNFSLDMFRLLCKNEKGNNVFVSPLSIMSALSMTLAGARGETATEMKKSLHLDRKGDDKIVHKEMGEYLKTLTRKSKDGSVTSNVANKVFVEKSFKVLSDFKKILTDLYKAKHGEVNFIKDSESAVAEINSWVEKETNGKIKDLVSSRSINSDTRLVLVNAIHFKGLWDSPFTKAETQKIPFHASASETYDVQMMRDSKTDLSYNFSEELGCHCVRLPFRDARYTLALIVPKERFGLDAAEQQLATRPELLCDLVESRRSKRAMVDLLLPRFQLECKFELEEQLPELGMKTLFSATQCDLSGISGDRNLVVSKVVHKSFLEVNEEGAEAAAAATGDMVMLFAPFMPPVEPIRVIADHPFLVAITYDTHPLFLGRINRPDSK